jgi:hypothetical protein
MALLLSGAAPTAQATDIIYNVLYMVGDYGSGVAAGQTVIAAAPDFTFDPGGGTTNLAKAAFFVRTAPPNFTKWWTVSMSAPTGQTLAVGDYTAAQRNADATHPGIDIGGACSYTYGEFHVLDIQRGANGAPTVFAADFAQYCWSAPGSGSLVSGSIRFNSTIAWSGFGYQSDVVDFGPALIGVASPVRGVMVKNNGPLPASFAATIDGLNSSDFAIVDDNSCQPTLDPGEICELGLTFTPSALGDRLANLRLHPSHFTAMHGIPIRGGGRNASQSQVLLNVAGSYPAPATVRVNVTPGNPYGKAQAEVGGVSYGSATVNAGTAIIQAFLPPGTLDLIGHFLGNDTLFQSYSSPLRINVPAATKTVFQIGPDTIQFGDEVHFYAYVQCAGSYDVSGGNLQIRDVTTNTQIGRQDFVGGRLELRVAKRVFDWPPHTYEAAFSGDSQCAASTQQINLNSYQIMTTTTMTLPVPAYYGQPITFIADVSPVPDGGVVEFHEQHGSGGSILGSAPVSPASGRASLTLTNLPPGVRTITAYFRGSGGFYRSNTEGEEHRVQFQTAMAVTATPDTVNAGVPTSVTGTVSGVSAGNPTAGTLTMTDVTGPTDRIIASTPVTSTNRKIVQALTFSQGTHIIEVSYTGPDEYSESAGRVTIVVGAASSDQKAPAGSVAINGGSSYTNNAQVNLTFSATDPAPGTGVAQMQISDAQDSWPDDWRTYATSLQWTFTGSDGSKQIYVRFKDGAGNVSLTASAGIVLDTTSPSQPAPEENLVVGSQLGAKIPVSVSFQATDPTSGIAKASLDQSINGGTTYTPITINGNPSSVTRSLTPGSTLYRFRARASDRAGNQTPWAAGSTFSVLVSQESACVFTGTWAKKSSTKASGKAYREASSAGASAVFTFIGDEVALAARRGPNAGRAAIYADGALVGTIDLYSATAKWRQITIDVSFLTNGSHRLEVRALGTKNAKSTGTKVGIDAFVVIK